MTTLSLPPLTTPTGVTGDGAGGIYIADSGNQHILRRTAAGTVFPIPGKFDSAHDVAVDGLGNLFIADGHSVRLLSSVGLATTFAGDGTFGYGGDQGPAMASVLNGPAGVSVGSRGSLYLPHHPNPPLPTISNAAAVFT